MAWTLEIHHIDVGQGDATLIIARDPMQPPDRRQRSVLIDGGMPIQASRLNDYVLQTLQGAKLDRILLSHYDLDHRGGIEELLIADNRYMIAHILGDYGARAAMQTAGEFREVCICATAAAIAAAAMGGYGDDAIINTAAIRARDMARNNRPHNDAQAVDMGCAVANQYIRSIHIPHQSMMRTYNLYNQGQASTEIREAGGRGSYAAYAAMEEGKNTYNDIYDDTLYGILAWLYEAIGAGSNQFPTYRTYSEALVVDQGAQTTPIPEPYATILRGGVIYNNGHTHWVDVVNRTRVSPGLDTEVLWRDVQPPPNAPTMWLMASNRWVRNRNDMVIGGNTPNNSGLAWVLKFNNFLYYTGGDMEDVLELPIAHDIRAHPIPTHAPEPVAPHVCAFKCGHHGSQLSTSVDFLGLLQPCAAFISCGNTSQSHPSSWVTRHLHEQGTIQSFYLSNCRSGVAHVSASQALNQFNERANGNKSVVCGEQVPFRDMYRSGHAVLRVSEQDSLSNDHDPNVPGPHKHRFEVEYFDPYVPGGPGVIRWFHVH